MTLMCEFDHFSYFRLALLITRLLEYNLGDLKRYVICCLLMKL